MDFSTIRFQNRFRVGLKQIYVTVYYMIEGLDVSEATREAVKHFNINHFDGYTTIQAKCRVRLAGSISTFGEWFKDGTLLEKIIEKKGLNRHDEEIFRKLFNEEELLETVRNDLKSMIEEEKDPTDKKGLEGRPSERFVRYHERNPKLRSEAIDIHGTKCVACGFDFESSYGQRGKGFIEVHHINPVSKLKEDTEINPETDMVVVCSNCHRMIHRDRNNVLSIIELKNSIEENKK
ncbi:MAG: HNH endonuclease [Gemmatimonadota bacterium]|nr:HNH endonuclease [Gemmatimonadota bacterium]